MAVRRLSWWNRPNHIRRVAWPERKGRAVNSSDQPDPMTAVLATYRLPEKTDFDNAWVGMEPTFQTKKSVKKWREMSQTPEGEDAYFEDAYMLKTQKKVAKGIQKKYETWRAGRRHPYCMF